MTPSTCAARQFRIGTITVLTLVVSAGGWGHGAPAEAAASSVDRSQPGQPLPPSSEHNAAYLELLGRSASFWALHVEIAAFDDVAVKGGVGYVSVDRYEGLHADVGVTYWAWSSGSSALVLNLVLVAAGMDPPVTDHYCDAPGAERCGPHLWWGAGLGAGIFYEFRSGILLRIGVTPTFWFYSESDWISRQFFEDAEYLWKLGAVQLGWSF